MAVPSSGELKLLGIFSEKSEDDYTAFNQDGESSFSLRGLSNNSHNDSTGGNINLNSANANPDQVAPYKMSEFYSYDHDMVALAIGNQKPQVYRYFSTPSPNNGQTISTQSALGTVATIPASNQSITGTSTKRGSFTSTNSSITTSSLNATVNNSSTNSWAIPTSGTLHNGFQYGITYYTTMWAHSSVQNSTVLSGTTVWAFTAAPTVTTQAASSVSGGFTMNGNITGLGLGSSPASGAVHRLVKRGFVYSTTQTSPTYFNATIAQNSASPGVFNTGSYTSNVTTSTAGTYYIRAFAYTEDYNTGPVAFHKYYAYGTVATFTIAPAYDYTATITVGSDQIYTTLAYGFGDLSWPDMGSISNTTFNSNTLLGMYWQNNASGTDYVYLYFMGSKPSFTELIIGTTNLGASSSWSSNSTTSWRKAVSSNPFASVGSTTSIYANY